MKIICTQENLKAGLTASGRIISTTNTLPILNNLLLKTENGQLKLSSTNLEIAITTNIRCKVEEEGSVTVVGKTLNELVNNLPNTNLTLESKEGELVLEADNYHTKIKTLPAEEFPLIPTVDKGVNLNLDSQELKAAIDQVFFAASNNQTQPEISGVLFALDNEGLRIVATDRYRLAEKKLVSAKSGNGALESILPQKTVVELSRIIGNQKGNVEIILGETQAAINFNETQIVSRLVDGQYPDYRQIIPANFITIVSTEKTPLISALRAAGVFSQNSNSVKVEVLAGGQQLVLNTESSELGQSRVELPSKVTGKDVSLILNYHYLLDALLSMEEKNINIKIIDDSSPSLVVPEGENSYFYLVMPIKS